MRLLIQRVTEARCHIAGEVFKYFLIGCFLMGIIIAIFVILDDTIRSEDYVSKTYDLPILSIIPALGEGASTAREAKAERRNS